MNLARSFKAGKLRDTNIFSSRQRRLNQESIVADATKNSCYPTRPALKDRPKVMGRYATKGRRDGCIIFSKTISWVLMRIRESESPSPEHTSLIASATNNAIIIKPKTRSHTSFQAAGAGLSLRSTLGESIRSTHESHPLRCLKIARRISLSHPSDCRGSQCPDL